MIRDLAFSVAMVPIGWQRAGVVIEKGADGRTRGKPRHYTPAKTRDAKAEIASAFSLAYPRHKVHEGPVEMAVVATFPVPPSWPKWKRTAAELGLWLHTNKPDGDNVAKAVMDSLNGRAYADDSQIFDLAVRREYGLDARVLVRMRLYEQPTREDLS